jgi:long-chain acyl-CoA synthetase
VTNTIFVPAVLQFLLAASNIRDVDFSTLEYILYGASPISEDVLRTAIDVFGCRFVQAYGLTETTGAITILAAEDHDPDDRPELLRSCGKPWPWVELRIVGPEGADVTEGDVGEIWTRSSQNTKGYWNMPEATAEVLTSDGWFKTGDAGYLEDGYLYLFDRVKDMVVSGGENVYPAEVENALMAHPDIADAAVVGVPHERWGETVKAIVVRAEGSAVRAEDIIAFTRERLAHYKCPTSVDFVDGPLPRNPSGKLLKRVLREPYWEGHERRIH